MKDLLDGTVVYVNRTHNGDSVTWDILLLAMREGMCGPSAPAMRFLSQGHAVGNSRERCAFWWV